MINSRRLMTWIPLGALLIVGGAALWFAWFADRDDDSQETYEVLVAASDIPKGAALDEAHVETMTIPKKFVPQNRLLEMDINIYLDRPAARKIRAREMLGSDDFVIVEEFRTSLIPHGKRSFQLPVDEIRSAPDHLVAGDRVDLTATLPADQIGLPDVVAEPVDFDEAHFVTVSILQQVRVMDVEDDGALTLVLTPEEAEFLAATTHRTALTVTGRNRKDLESQAPEMRTLESFLEQLEDVHRIRNESAVVDPTYRCGAAGHFFDLEKEHCLPRFEGPL